MSERFYHEKIYFLFLSCGELVRYSCECLAGSVGKYENKSTDALLDECNTIAFADSDPELWGQSYFGHEIISPEKINEHDFDKVVVISFTVYDDIHDDIDK